MLVDNPLQQSFFSSSSSSSTFPDYSNDLSEYLNPELFGTTANQGSSSKSDSSRASSPQSPFQALLSTPPQSSLPTSFPDIQDYGSGYDYTNGLSGSSFFNLLEDDMKLIDPATSMSLAASSAPFDFFGSLSGGGGAMATTDPSSSSNPSPTGPERGIDPQLMGTPSTSRSMSDFDEEEEKQIDAEQEPAKEKLTLTIAPVKVGGHGKARKGTVQSGGIVKKTAVSPAASTASTMPVPPASRNKENVKGRSTSPNDGDDDEDLPADWRPPPEIYQKMSSKEKRQLRNKISARNFRVRRKEYISTLELDIAERDRLLQAIRSELGSTQSENIALRQEISALKKALLEGRSGVLKSEDVPQLNLPPPAPLPPLNTSSFSSPSNASTSSPIITPNTQKDLPSTTAANASPRLGAFWGGVGGVGMGGGITPVHTVLMPEPASFLQKNQGSVRAALQENMNPALNNPAPGAPAFSKGGMVGGFDGFVDMNPFTMKTLDAYRMQLWTRMAAQQYNNSNNHRSSPPPIIGSPSPFTQQPLPGSATPSPPLHGLALQLRQLHFAPSSKANLPPPSNILAGKHSSPSPLLPSPSSLLLAPPFGKKEGPSAKDKEHAMLAAYASQSLFGKLTGAFWDAFNGSPSSSSSAHPGWDAEKVRKVLEGKAIVKIVDVEPVVVKKEVPSPKLRSTSPMERACESCSVSALLEEGMRSLTLGKK